MSEIVVTGTTAILTEELVKSNKRVKELESVMQEFINEFERGGGRSWEIYKKFKQLLEA